MEYVQRCTLASDKTPAFRSWLADSESRIRKESPEGWTYLGTFFVVHATADYTCETRWRLDSYASLAPDAAMQNPTWLGLVKEFTDVMVDVPPLRTVLMNPASDVKILQDEDS